MRTTRKRARGNELRLFYGRLPGEAPDVIVSWGAECAKCDSRLVMHHFTTKLPADERSFLEELKTRGYDLNTLEFRIRKATPPEEPTMSEIEIGAWPDPATSGQHVGMPKGVKVTHKPTGIIVICDTERSQHANRQKALDFIARALEQREGFVMVPVEPTPEMVNAACAIKLRRLNELAAGKDGNGIEAGIREDYSAMLAAAPKPEESGRG